MATIRTHKKENPFVMLDKRLLEDTRLSWEAKGLHAYLMSKPDSWTVNVKHLVKQSRNGRDATYRIVNELIYAGYIERIQERSEDGRLGDIEYIVYETPTHLDPFELPKKTRAKKNEELPHTEIQETVVDPYTGNQYTENTDISNKEVSNNDLKIKRDDDNTHTRESINLLIFEKYKEKITHEQFAIVLDRIPVDKETVNYKNYLVTCVESEIKELARKQSESTRKQQSSTSEDYSQKKKKVKGQAKGRTEGLYVVPDATENQVSEDEFEKMMEFAKRIEEEKNQGKSAVN